MSRARDEMIEWAANQVGVEGITLDVLFIHFDTEFKQEISRNPALRNQVWEGLKKRDDLAVEEGVDEDVKDHIIDALLIDGFGWMKIMKKEDVGIQSNGSPVTRTEIEETIATSASVTEEQAPSIEQPDQPPEDTIIVDSQPETLPVSAETASPSNPLSQFHIQTSNDHLQTPTDTPVKRKRGRPKGSKTLDVNSSLILPGTPSTGPRTSGRQPKARDVYDPTAFSPPPTSDSTPHITSGIRTAIFTSQADLDREEDIKQRQAGVARVYIDLPETTEGRPKKSLIALFKSEKLKNPNWLDERQATWIEVLEERKKLGAIAAVAAAAEREGDANDAAQKKRKRQSVNPNEEGAPVPKKRGRPRKNPEITDSNTNANAAQIRSSTPALLGPTPASSSFSNAIGMPTASTPDGVQYSTLESQSGSTVPIPFIKRASTGPSQPTIAPPANHISQQSPSVSPQSVAGYPQASSSPFQHIQFTPNQRMTYSQPASQPVASTPPASSGNWHTRYSHKSTSSLPQPLNQEHAFSPPPNTPLLPLKPLNPLLAAIVNSSKQSTYKSPYKNNAIDPTAYSSPFTKSDQPSASSSSDSSRPLDGDNSPPVNTNTVSYLVLSKQPYISPYGPASSIAPLPSSATANTPFSGLPLIQDAARRNSLQPPKAGSTSISSQSQESSATQNRQSNLHSQISTPVAQSTFVSPYARLPNAKHSPPTSQPPPLQLSKSVPQEPSKNTSHHFGPSTHQQDGFSQVSPSREKISGVSHQWGPLFRPIDYSSLQTSNSRSTTLPAQQSTTNSTSIVPPLQTVLLNGQKSTVTLTNETASQKKRKRSVVEDNLRKGPRIDGPQGKESSILPSIEIIPNDPEIATQPMGSESMAPVVESLPSEEQPARTSSAKEPESTPSEPVNPFAAAEAITIIDASATMPSIYNDVLGSLVLSEDKTKLKFQRVEGDAESPELMLKISKLAENPITSMKGSNPMELRIKAKNSDDSIILHRFRIGATDAAYQSANNMRSKIVTARIAVQMSGAKSENESEHEATPPPLNEAALAALKPFRCENCGSRFKNREGIKYHLEKSQTTCNPNFNPELHQKKRVGPKPKLKKRKEESDDETPKRKRRLNNERNIVRDDLDGESSSSEDSIFEWARRHAAGDATRSTSNTVEPTTGKKPTQKSIKVYKSVPGEELVLKEAFETPADTETAEQAPTSSTLELIQDDPLTQDELTDKRSKAVVLELVEANRGIFPGERGLWYGFVASWLREFAMSGVLPEYKLCQKALDALIQDGKLQKTGIMYKDHNGVMRRKNLIIQPSANPSTTDIKKLRDAIVKADPSYYVPPAFAPPPNILERLESLRQNSSVAQESDTEDDSETVHSPPTSTSSKDDEFVPDDDPKQTIEYSDDGLSEDSDDDFLKELIRPIKQHYRSRKSTATNANSRQGSVMTPRQNAGISTAKNSTAKRARVPLTAEEIQRRKKAASIRQQAWGAPAPAFLPNSETGAWDQKPGRPPKNKIKYHRKYRLPEPQTFMQATDSTWSFRPFGHGAHPIFARPSKRLEGTAKLEDYLYRIESGYRPIIYPSKNPNMTASYQSRPTVKPTPENVPTLKTPRPRQSKSSAAPTEQHISKRTGLPKRKWTRRRESTVFSDDDDEPPRRQTNSRAADISEADILNHWESKPLDPNKGRQKNPGLDSMPARYGLLPIEKQSASEDFAPVLPAKFFPPNEKLGKNDSEQYLEFHDYRTAVDYGSVKLSFLDQTAFTSETLPYDSLKTDDEEEEMDAVELVIVHPAKKAHGIGGNKKTKEGHTLRLQTASHADLEGIHDNIHFAAAEFGIEVVTLPGQTGTRKRYTGSGLKPDEEMRLIVAVVIIRTLLGGLDLMVDWVLVNTVFPRLSVNYLMKQYRAIAKIKERAIEQLTEDFRSAFLKAYEAGKLPLLDYDNLAKYDWNMLVDWTLKNVTVRWGNESIDLPPSREKILETYEFKPLPADSHLWRDLYFNHQAAVYRRVDLITSVQHVRPITANSENYTTRTNSFSDDIDDEAIARSIARASILTPEDSFDYQAASEITTSIGEERMAIATEQLLSRKVLIKPTASRMKTNRQFEPSDIFYNALKKHLTPGHFIAAYQFKLFLDSEFASGKECVRFNSMADEGTILCITNLQAHERILIKGEGIPAKKFGLTEGGYQTRNIDKAKYNFKMDIYPTSTYVYSSPPSVFPSPAQAFMDEHPAPKGSDKGEIPVWCGIGEQRRLIKEIWINALAGVAQTVAFRGGSDKEMLCRVYAPSLEGWEMGYLVEWGKENGVLRDAPYVGGEVEAYTTGEWWWEVLGKCCLEEGVGIEI